jgi:hypothetical protein
MTGRRRVSGCGESRPARAIDLTLQRSDHASKPFGGPNRQRVPLLRHVFSTSCGLAHPTLHVSKLRASHADGRASRLVECRA